jgi:hypothetical protein
LSEFGDGVEHVIDLCIENLVALLEIAGISIPRVGYIAVPGKIVDQRRSRVATGLATLCVTGVGGVHGEDDIEILPVLSREALAYVLGDVQALTLRLGH